MVPVCIISLAYSRLISLYSSACRERKALRDLPHIVRFFLAYILGVRALPEHEKSLNQALQVARRATIELPLTRELGVGIPDKLASCLINEFGAQTPQQSWGFPDSQDGEVGDEWQPAVEPEINTTANEDAGPDTGDTVINVNDGTTAGWGMDVDASEWGTIGVADWGAQPDQNDDPWKQDEHNLTELIGPNSLSSTHSVGYVEESVRWISSVSVPFIPKSTGNDGQPTPAEKGLHTFARVELKPYSSYADASAPLATIQPPVVLKDPSKDGDAPRYDPLKDSITMLLDRGLARKIEGSSGRGIGLRGVFVQLASKGSVVNGEGEKKDGKDEHVFWYLEKLHQVIPSFWTEKQG
jgi:hypothetical protein